MTYIINEKVQSEVDYAKTLNSLYEFNYCTDMEGSIANAINQFKETLNIQQDLIIKTTSNIQCKVLDDIKEFVYDQINESRFNFSNINNLNLEFKQNISELIANKVNFHAYAKAAEEAKISFELSKLNVNAKQDQKNKLNSRLNTCISEAKEAEMMYRNSVLDCNNFKDNYVKETEKIYSLYQKMETEYNDFVKQKLIDYNKEMLSYAESLASIANKNLEFLTLNVNTQKDIEEMIEKYQTNYLPPNKIEFIPYTPNIEKTMILKSVEMNNQKNSFTVNNQNPPNSNLMNPNKIFINNFSLSELINNIKNFSKSVFTSEVADCINMQESKTFSEIRSYLNNIWEGKTIEEEERKNFIEYIKDKNYRRYFLSSLNKFRINGLFLLDNKAYDNLVDCLRRVLDIAFKDRDDEAIKFSIILSQTFYKIVNNINCFLNFESGESLRNNELGIHKNSFSQGGNNLASNEVHNININNNNNISNNASNTVNNNTSTITTTVNNDTATTTNAINAETNLSSTNSNYIFTKPSSNSSYQATEKEDARSRKNNNNNSKNKNNYYDPLLSPKVFIQSGIQNHECFSDTETWKGVIKYSIKEELNSKSGINIESYFSSNNITNIEMIKNIAFGQLLSVGYNMLSFGFSKETVFSLTKQFAKLHDIAPEMENLLFWHLEEFNTEVQDKIKNEINLASSLNVNSILEETPDQYKSDRLKFRKASNYNRNADNINNEDEIIKKDTENDAIENNENNDNIINNNFNNNINNNINSNNNIQEESNTFLNTSSNYGDQTFSKQEGYRSNQDEELFLVESNIRANNTQNNNDSKEAEIELNKNRNSKDNEDREDS